MERSYGKRNVMLHFKASEREEQVLAAMSVLEGRNWSEMLRQCLREAAERRGIGIAPAVQSGNVSQGAAK